MTWIVLDTSPSMAFGTADAPQGGRRARCRRSRSGTRRPCAATGSGWSASAAANDSAPPEAGPGRPARRPLGLKDGHEPDRSHGTGVTLADALRRLAGAARQRSLVTVVSDFRGPLDWRKPLLELAGRHDVLAVEIRDPREQQLAPAGSSGWSTPRRATAAGGHERRAAPRAVRRRRRGGACRGRAGARGVPAPPTSSSRPTATGCGARGSSEKAPVSFAAPSRSRLLAVLPLAVGAYIVAGRRRSRGPRRVREP